MTPQEIRNEATALVTLAGNVREVSANALYDIALRMRNVRDTATRGDEAIPRLARHMRWRASTIYAYIRVTDTWNIEQFHALTARRTPRGRALTWSHFVALAGVHDTRTRTHMISLAIQHGWTVAQLLDAINPPEEAAAAPVANDVGLAALAADIALLREEVDILRARCHALETGATLLRQREANVLQRLANAGIA